MLRIYRRTAVTNNTVIIFVEIFYEYIPVPEIRIAYIIRGKMCM